MKNYLIVAILLVTLVPSGQKMAIAQAPATAEMTDKEFAEKIAKEGNADASRDIDLAAKLDRPAALLAVAVDPTLSKSSEAVAALSRLPVHEAAHAYAEILKMDSLWEPWQLGGRFGATQGDFVAKMKSALSTVCDRSLAQADLFDKITRVQIIVTLQTK